MIYCILEVDNSEQWWAWKKYATTEKQNKKQLSQNEMFYNNKNGLYHLLVHQRSSTDIYIMNRQRHVDEDCQGDEFPWAGTIKGFPTKSPHSYRLLKEMFEGILLRNTRKMTINKTAVSGLTNNHPKTRAAYITVHKYKSLIILKFVHLYIGIAKKN